MSASAGRVLILPKGDYDNTVEYKMLDMVTYQNGSYLCKQTTTGNLPTDTTYWQEMITTPDMTGASAGAAGVHGLVPAPSAGDQAKFLQGDGTWAAVDLSSKADQSIIGGSYNASTAYEPGDRFSYNGVRYKVIIESGTVQGQTPPNATYYEECSVDDDISTLNNSLTGEILWTNSSPTSDFAAQTITVPNNNYKYYKITSLGHRTYSGTSFDVKLEKKSGVTTALAWTSVADGSLYIWTRGVQIGSQLTQIVFQDAYEFVATFTGTSVNARLIPYQIIGTNIP